jgi:hypothetical protein
MLIAVNKIYRGAGKPRAPMNEYWRNSFPNGLAFANDGGDIIGPENGRLSEAGRA